MHGHDVPPLGEDGDDDCGNCYSARCGGHTYEDVSGLAPFLVQSCHCPIQIGLGRIVLLLQFLLAGFKGSVVVFLLFFPCLGKGLAYGVAGD